MTIIKKLHEIIWEIINNLDGILNKEIQFYLILLATENVIFDGKSPLVHSSIYHELFFVRSHVSKRNRYAHRSSLSTH